MKLQSSVENSNLCRNIQFQQHLRISDSLTVLVIISVLNIQTDKSQNKFPVATHMKTYIPVVIGNVCTEAQIYPALTVAFESQCIQWNCPAIVMQQAFVGSHPAKV